MSVNLTGQNTLPTGTLVHPGPILASGGQGLRIGDTIPNTFDPRVSGLSRPVGSFVYTRDGTLCYEKTGTATTAWSIFGPAATAPMTLTLADATTNTAPDILVLQHTTSGTAAAGFGITMAVELENAAGTTRRAVTAVPSYVVATDTSETAKLQLQGISQGTLTDLVCFAFEQNQFQTMYFGAPASGNGWRAFSGNVDLLLAGSSSILFRGGAGAANNPSICFGGSFNGFYPITNGVGISANQAGVLLLAKTATPFVFTAPLPTAGNNTASTEFVAFDVNMSRTATWATGALATQRELLVRKPTYAFAGASTLTTAATVAIEGAPVAGANATITNPYAFWVQAGAVRFDGNFGFGVAPAAASAVAALTNNVTSGGTNDTIANYTDLTIYANDAAAIRNDIYQLARKTAQVVTALRANGILV